MNGELNHDTLRHWIVQRFPDLESAMEGEPGALRDLAVLSAQMDQAVDAGDLDRMRRLHAFNREVARAIDGRHGVDIGVSNAWHHVPSGLRHRREALLRLIGALPEGERDAFVGLMPFPHQWLRERVVADGIPAGGAWTLAAPAEGHARHINQMGAAIWGVVSLRVVPVASHSVVVQNRMPPDDRFPIDGIRATMDGVGEALGEAEQAGTPLRGLVVEITAGEWHDVDSSERHFRIATCLAFRKACQTTEMVALRSQLR